LDNLGSVFVIVDPTAAVHPCVSKAARLAAGFHATLELAICDYQRGADASRFYDAESFELARSRAILPHQELLEALAAPLRGTGLKVETTVILENPRHAGLLARIRHARPDLVVKDTHYHSVIRRALVTNTDWHLIRDCPAPLLLVKGRDWPDGELNVACAVDPGHADDKPWSLDHEIIGAMQYLATGLPMDMNIVNAFSAVDDVISASAGGMAESAVIGGSLIETARKNQLATLAKLASGHRVDPSHIHLLEGAAVEALPKFVERDRPDILIMGAIARGRLFNYFIGSTAEAVLDRLSCDVLIVKPARLTEQMWSQDRA
jgi:universal stress protein E